MTFFQGKGDPFFTKIKLDKSGAINDFIKNVVDSKTTRSIPSRQPREYCAEYFQFLSINNMTDNVTSAIVWSFLAMAKEVFNVPISGFEALSKIAFPHVHLKTENDVDLGKGTKPGKEVTVSLMEEIPEVPNPVFAKAIFGLHSVLHKAVLMIIETVGSYQVSGLRERNLINYFKMAGVEVNAEAIMAVVSFLSSSLPRFVETDAFKDIIKKEKWVKYHTTAASSQHLVQKCIEDTSMLELFSAETKKAVKASCDAPWDIELNSKIPEKAIQITYIYLTTAGGVPDKWYQGEKAFERASPILKITYKAIFDKLSSVYGNDADIRAAASAEALTKIIKDKKLDGV